MHKVVFKKITQEVRESAYNTLYEIFSRRDFLGFLGIEPAFQATKWLPMSN
jgi:hypothetical protein